MPPSPQSSTAMLQPAYDAAASSTDLFADCRHLCGAVHFRECISPALYVCTAMNAYWASLHTATENITLLTRNQTDPLLNSQLWAAWQRRVRANWATAHISQQKKANVVPKCHNHGCSTPASARFGSCVGSISFPRCSLSKRLTSHVKSPSAMTTAERAATTAFAPAAAPAVAAATSFCCCCCCSCCACAIMSSRRITCKHQRRCFVTLQSVYCL